ncbi:MAG: RNA polymerase sigma factor RpoD/SigA [Spirochaetes bacterium]|nr:MAG: RNA polymerase sigma factor RpoD/SigA [Spirochaetota bacterium]
MNKRFVNFETDDSIAKYFKEVRKSVILTPDEEIALAKRIKQGDEKAKEELVNANLKFVVSIAKEYQNQGLPLSDLISEGNYGLIKAANRFDHKRGFRFISYAVWWVKQSIIQSLNENARVVRLPANIINKITKLNKEISKFENDNEREPVYGEIFKGENQTAVMLSFPKSTSLNQLINEDGDELIELIPADFVDADEIEINTKIKEELNRTLDVLDEREKMIIESYFGINTDCEPMTLEAIGEKYNLTKERIRQIKEKAIRKLRHNAQALQMLMNE